MPPSPAGPAPGLALGGGTEGPTVEAGCRDAILASDNVKSPPCSHRKDKRFLRHPCSPPRNPPQHGGGKRKEKTSRTGRGDFSTIYIISYIYISSSLYLLTSVTHLKCHRDQNRATFWWNSQQSYTRYKTKGLCLLIHHTINFSSIFYIQRATLLGKKFKKDKVGYES